MKGAEPYGLLTIRANSIDKWIWIIKLSYSFSYKYYFELLVDDPNLLDFDYFDSVWKRPSSSKVKVLKWLIVLVKVNTLNRIQSKIYKLYFT